MRIGAIIPTHDNRPILLSRCKEYIKRQTMPINAVLFVDYPQKTFPVDITERYAYGLDQLKNECDVIFLIENDDWYSEHYIKSMIAAWLAFDKPELFGIGETHFYHIEKKYYWNSTHEERACAYCTMISTSAIDKIDYRKINPLLFDLGIWKQKNIQKKTCKMDSIITIGIKHGRGHCGAAGHNQWFYERAKTPGIKDNDYQWLNSKIGNEDLEWYKEFVKQKGA